MMPTHKTFKGRVRARMTKTGESYTTARSQLLRKTSAGHATAPAEPEAPTAATPAASADVELPTSDAAVSRATGHGYAHWFALLDAWGAAERDHTTIARWLRDDNGVDGWWSQNVTVAYERGRGLRGVGQMAKGYSIGVSRTIAADVATALTAFTDPPVRERWLPDAPMTQRRTTAAGAARFDWTEPPSRLVVSVSAKGDRSTVWVTHEQLPDAASAERQKTAWRTRLAALKSMLETDAG